MLRNKIKLLSVIFSAFAIVTLSAMKHERDVINESNETSPLKKNKPTTSYTMQSSYSQTENVHYNFSPVNDSQKQTSNTHQQNLLSPRSNTSNQKK